MTKPKNKPLEKYDLTFSDAEEEVILKKLEMAREQVNRGQFITEEELDEEIKNLVLIRTLRLLPFASITLSLHGERKNNP